MSINAQIAISRSSLSSNLSQDRSSLSTRSSGRSFDTEFRKALSQNTVRDRPKTKEPKKDTRDLKDRMSNSKDEDKKLELGEKSEKSEETEKTKENKTDKKKVESSDEGEIKAAVDSAYNNLNIDPEFMKLLGRNDLNIEIDEENQEIIILDEQTGDNLAGLVEKNGLDLGDLDNISNLNQDRINYGDLENLLEESSLDSLGDQETIEEVKLNPELVDKLNQEPVKKESQFDRIENLSEEDKLGIDRLPLEEIDISSEEDLNLTEEGSDEGEEAGDILDNRLAGLDMRSIQTSMTASNTELESLDRLFEQNIENIEDTIIGNIDTVVEGETTTMKLALYPRDLGSINIELTMENGKLQGKIMTEDAATKQMLTQNLSKLTENLLEQDIQISEIEISLNNNNSGWDDQNQEEASNWDGSTSQNLRSRNLRLGNLGGPESVESVVPRQLDRDYLGNENLNILV